MVGLPLFRKSQGMKLHKHVRWEKIRARKKREKNSQT